MRLPKKSQFPATILVGSTVWSVRFVREIEQGYLGLCDSTTNTIYIKQGQSPKERLSTFLHEVLHAFEYEYGMDLSSKTIENRGEHELVNDLESAILYFLLDNPDGLASLLGIESYAKVMVETSEKR